MADEVEDILREIADRVRAEQANVAVQQNGTGDDTALTAQQARSLSSIEAHLTTTARAWDRLPPVMSNRSGTAARLELWVKRLFKRSTRWYSWEQVNFNAAVHHAFLDTLAALNDVQRQLQSIRSEIQTHNELIAKRIEQLGSDIQKSREMSRADVSAVRTLLAQEAELRHSELQRQRKELADQRQELQSLLESQLESQGAAQLAKITNEIEGTRAEMLERADGILEEQRVSVKQLSIELSEITTLADRTRRALETRLEKLEQNSPKK